MEATLPTALALAALPAAANLAGGLTAEVMRISRRSLDLALYAAAGIVVAMVGVELMPRVLSADRPWVGIAAFVAGGGFAVLVPRLLSLLQRDAAGLRSRGPDMIYLGVSVHLFSDGLLIGTGATVAGGLALLLALAQTLADLPEGFGSIASLRDHGLSRRRRLLAVGGFVLTVLAGATLGFLAVRGRPALVKLSLLAFAASVLLTVALEEMMVEARAARHQAGVRRDPLEALSLVGGFALFSLLAAYI